MTARRFLTITAAVIAVVAAGSLLRPLLNSHRHVRDVRPAAAAAAPADAAAVRVAADAARGAVHCDNSTVACGSLRILRTESRCASPTPCTVQLLGTVTAGGATSPAGLTVITERRHNGWTVSEVRP